MAAGSFESEPDPPKMAIDFAANLGAGDPGADLHRRSTLVRLRRSALGRLQPVLELIVPDQAEKINPIAIRLAGLIIKTCWALLLAAPLILPLAEFAGLSTRAGMAQADRLAYSLPISRLLGLAVPDFHGFHEYMLYLSQVVLILAILAPLVSGSRRETRFWLAVFLISLLISSGENFPPYRWLTGLPGISWLRVPARALFVSGLAAAALASHALERMSQPLDRSNETPGKPVHSWLCWFPARVVPGRHCDRRQHSPEFRLGSSAGIDRRHLDPAAVERADLSPDLVGRFDRSLRDRSGGYGPVAVRASSKGSGALLKEFCWRRRSKESIRRAALTESIPPHTASPSRPLPSNTLSLQMEWTRSTSKPMPISWSRPLASLQMGYAVSIPPFSGGDPAKDNEGYLPDPGLLGLLNVRFVASEFDLNTPDLEYKGQVDSNSNSTKTSR